MERWREREFSRYQEKLVESCTTQSPNKSSGLCVKFLFICLRSPFLTRVSKQLELYYDFGKANISVVASPISEHIIMKVKGKLDETLVEHEAENIARGTRRRIVMGAIRNNTQTKGKQLLKFVMKLELHGVSRRIINMLRL